MKWNGRKSRAIKKMEARRKGRDDDVLFKEGRSMRPLRRKFLGSFAGGFCLALFA